MRGPVIGLHLPDQPGHIVPHHCPRGCGIGEVHSHSTTYFSNSFLTADRSSGSISSVLPKSELNTSASVRGLPPLFNRLKISLRTPSSSVRTIYAGILYSRGALAIWFASSISNSASLFSGKFLSHVKKRIVSETSRVVL